MGTFEKFKIKKGIKLNENLIASLRRRKISVKIKKKSSDDADILLDKNLRVLISNFGDTNISWKESLKKFLKKNKIMFRTIKG